MKRALALFLVVAAVTTVQSQDGYPSNYVAATLVQLNDNGAWSWFMDPRVIVNEGKLISGSVRAVGSNQANVTDPRSGNVEVSVYDIEKGTTATVVLHPHLEQDDHDAPTFLVRKDGRYLAVYSKHTKERRMYYRLSEPHNPLVWGPAMVAATPGTDTAVQGDNATYANLFRMPNGRIYNGRGLPTGQGGLDLRYHYARWNGTTWHTEEIAHAGQRLYPTEDDYSGLGALDPNNPDVAFISTDADPVTGAPLVSRADQQRHYELFRGERGAAGKWTWTPFTRNSTTDNLRPVIPQWNDRRTALVWMRGKCAHNQGEWYSAMVGAIVAPRL